VKKNVGRDEQYANKHSDTRHQHEMYPPVFHWDNRVLFLSWNCCSTVQLCAPESAMALALQNLSVEKAEDSPHVGGLLGTVPKTIQGNLVLSVITPFITGDLDRILPGQLP
jgi:hypothetical protein